MPYLDYDYLDPLHIVWRDGTAQDPYILKSEFIKVVNQTIVLTEIPDKSYRVRINGYKEINYESFNDKGLDKNEFYVNYATGILQLNSDAEYKTLNITYKGRGFIQYPADRIYYQDKFNNVVYSLKDIIENTKRGVDDIGFKFKELEGMLGKVENALDINEKAVDGTNKATEDAKVATDLALDAHNTTKLIFKEYVMTYSDIAVKFPNPKVGWTTSVYDTGERFRFDGHRWIPIDIISGNVPDATEVSNGLMKKEHFKKVEDISEDTDLMIMYFVIPDEALQGVQAPKLKFKTKGKILSVEAYVGTKGNEDLPIDVQVSTDYENWDSILDFPLLIEGGSYEDNKSHIILDDEVLSENVYRIFVQTFTSDARDLQVLIKTKRD